MMQKKWLKVVVYLMLFAMVASTLLALFEPIFLR